MRQYIQNLTDNLIGKNRYDDIRKRIQDSAKFLEHVQHDLEAGDVRDMRPETLGKIMCSFDIGDVMASKKEITERMHFAGDCEEMLRELVSLCLAYAIRDRVEPFKTQVPQYKRA